jgi:hypothetical protein
MLSKAQLPETPSNLKVFPRQGSIQDSGKQLARVSGVTAMSMGQISFSILEWNVAFLTFHEIFR